MKKRWILVLIIAFPSFLWLILETSTINSRKLPYYGPKTIIGDNDTVYHKVSQHFYDVGSGERIALDTTDYPLYAIAFLRNDLRDEGYRVVGLWEYLNYKKDKVGHIPFVLVADSTPDGMMSYHDLVKMDGRGSLKFVYLPHHDFTNTHKNYFKARPYYTDNSFFVLVDHQRHIRGYYDARYVSEMKRLIDEYRHLRIKEEKKKIIRQNEIKQDN